MAFSADDFRKKIASQRTPAKTPQKPPPRLQKPAQPAEKDDRLPDAPEIEKAVLQVIFANADAGFSAFEHSGRKSFFANPVNLELYNIARAFHAEQGRLDWIAFTSHLQNLGRFDELGGHAVLTDLFVPTGGVAPPFEMLDYYLNELREKYLRRKIIRCSFSFASKGSSSGVDVVDLLADMSHSVEDMRSVASGPNGAVRFEFVDLMAFDGKHDPNCLVGNRYLVRGGSSLWAAGSGYGKSTLALQLAVYWACGQTCFGLRPVRPLKSLIIQAENDLGDMSEQLQGVITGVSSIGDIDVKASQDLIQKNIVIHRAIGKTGSNFLALLDSLLEIDRSDLAWIDPMFAFAGCDLLDARQTSHFLRDGLFPIAHRRAVALNVIHHVGKPVRADTKSNPSMADIDLQYLGFGTSEIQNAFRVVNVLVPVSGNPGLFKLGLSKRGERSGAGRYVYLRHSEEGMICWMQAEEPVIPEKQRPLKYTNEDVRDQMSKVTGWPAKQLQIRCYEETGMSEKTFYRIWKRMKKEEEVYVDSDDKWFLK